MVNRFRHRSRKRSSKSPCDPSSCLFRRRCGQSFRQNWLHIRSSNRKPYHSTTSDAGSQFQIIASWLKERSNNSPNCSEQMEVDDIISCQDVVRAENRVEHVSREKPWVKASATPIVDLTLLAATSSRLSFVCVAVSETLKQLPYEQEQILSALVRKRTHRDRGAVPCVPYAAASRANTP
jgi:hypothetical protein